MLPLIRSAEQGRHEHLLVRVPQYEMNYSELNQINEKLEPLPKIKEFLT
jgi:hypothetical protein